MASPAHHADQTGQNRVIGMSPESTSVQVPAVALISIGSRPPRKTSARASRSRSISTRKPALRSIRYAHTGARVFPAMMPRLGKSTSLIRSMARYAPRAIPGHIRRPSQSRAATAMPVGGHRGVTSAPSTTTRWRRPSRPLA